MICLHSVILYILYEVCQRKQDVHLVNITRSCVDRVWLNEYHAYTAASLHEVTSEFELHSNHTVVTHRDSNMTLVV